METRLFFRFVLFDTLTVAPGETKPGEHHFFVDSSDSEGSIDRMGETSILKWLVAQPAASTLVVNAFGFQQPVVGIGVTKPFLPRHGSGDVDLLLCAVHQPQRAVAVQAKRFKVVPTDNGDKVSLDPEKLATLVEQCRKTRELGFHQTYALVIAMIDARAYPNPNVAFRGTSETTFQRLYAFPTRESLPPDVGITFLEVVQPTGRSIDRTAMVAIAIDKHAGRLEQPRDLTEKVATWCTRTRARRCLLERRGMRP